MQRFAPRYAPAGVGVLIWQANESRARRCAVAVIASGALKGLEHDTRKLPVWRSQVPDQRPTVRHHELPLLDVPEGERGRLSQPGSRQVGRV